MTNSGKLLFWHVARLNSSTLATRPHGSTYPGHWGLTQLSDSGGESAGQLHRGGRAGRGCGVLLGIPWTGGQIFGERSSQLMIESELTVRVCITADLLTSDAYMLIIFHIVVLNRWFVIKGLQCSAALCQKMFTKLQCCLLKRLSHPFTACRLDVLCTRRRASVPWPVECCASVPSLCSWWTRWGRWTREATPALHRTCREPDQCQPPSQFSPRPNPRRSHEWWQLAAMWEGGDQLLVTYKHVIEIKHRGTEQYYSGSRDFGMYVNCATLFNTSLHIVLYSLQPLLVCKPKSKENALINQFNGNIDNLFFFCICTRHLPHSCSSIWTAFGNDPHLYLL